MSASKKRKCLPTRPALFAALIVAGCDSGDVVTYDPVDPPAASLEVRITTPDADVASALGWSGGRVPGARVIFQGDGGPWSAEGITNEDGVVSFQEVPTGSYTVSVTRELSDAEQEAAAATGALLLTREVWWPVHSVTTTIEIEVSAALRRSIVVREFNFAPYRAANQTSFYYPGGFLELYNNADTVIHLDGMIVGMGIRQLRETPPGAPCVAYDDLRSDPLGVWSDVFDRFPGSGTDYPLEPGQAVVIATDAIDHRPFAPTAPDLSGADFEFRGPEDVDNPAVPDMIPSGPRQHPRGRGTIFPGDAQVFVAMPVVIEELTDTVHLGNQYLRFPTESILEFFVTAWDGDHLSQWPVCAAISPPILNRYHAPAPDDFSELSLHRRILFTHPDGRVMLQHTRDGFSDFYLGPRSLP